MTESMRKAMAVAVGLALSVAGVACPGRDLGPVRPVVQSGTSPRTTQCSTT
jgi:hypothetical protein